MFSKTCVLCSILQIVAMTFSSADAVMTLVPAEGEIQSPGAIQIKAYFGPEIVKKAKVELWRDAQGRKDDKQKLNMEIEDEASNLYTATTRSSLEEGKFCYKVQVEFKSGKDKKLNLDEVCFLVATLSVGVVSREPSLSQSLQPSHQPSTSPSRFPVSSTIPSKQPSSRPSTRPTLRPSRMPSTISEVPSQVPSKKPSQEHVPSKSSLSPSTAPSKQPISEVPSFHPSSAPSDKPSFLPDVLTHSPTTSPSSKPTTVPTFLPTFVPFAYTSPTESPTTETLLAGSDFQYRREAKVEVKWTADRYAQEFSFQIVDTTGNIIMEKKRSKEIAGRQTEMIEVGPTYCFRGTDDYGDGICCGQGNGGYEVLVDSVSLFKGGAFRFSTGYRCFVVNQLLEAKIVEPPETAHCEANDPNTFNICMEIVDVSNGKLKEQRLLQKFSDSFLAAKEKWSTVLKDDDGTDHDLLGYLVDDLYIEAAAASIDGAGESSGNILGFAGPGLTWKSPEGFVNTFSGFMVFDLADIPEMVKENILQAVVEHEIIHVLGLGTLWDENGLYVEGGPYQGKYANEAYRTILVKSGASQKEARDATVPVEQEGGKGTAHAHFDEQCLHNEISTGWINEENVLSNITLAALHDLGLGVDFDKAEAYIIPNVSKCGLSRRLRARRPRGWRQLSGKPIDELDASVVEHAAREGRKFLHAHKPQELSNGVDDAGSKLVHVLFNNGSNDGSIFSVVVHEEN